MLIQRRLISDGYNGELFALDHFRRFYQLRNEDGQIIALPDDDDEAFDAIEDGHVMLDGDLFAVEFDGGDIFAVRRADDSSDLGDFGDVELRELNGFDVPDWIESDATLSQMMDASVHGCASGCYMPAVTYHQALSVMNEHGDAVMDYLDDAGMDWQTVAGGATSWAGLACDVLSRAVEAWAYSLALAIDDSDEEIEVMGDAA